MKNEMEQIIEVDISKVKTNPNQPRKEFDEEKLKDLASSIKEIGLINPIQIKKDKDNYELICGERRLKAHKLLNKKTIKAIVKNYNSKTDEMIESLIENLHRTDLNSVEKENYISELWNTRKFKTNKELGKAVGFGENWIYGIKLAKKIRKETLASKKISTRNILELGRIKDLGTRKKLLKKLEKKELNSKTLRDACLILCNSPEDITQAYFSNKISIQQAKRISKLKDIRLREKVISTHNEIKKIGNSIERSIKKEVIKNPSKLIKTKEVIEYFRNKCIENQKSMQGTIKSLIFCMPYISLMDSKQMKRLNHFQNLLEVDLSNFLQLSENLKKKISLNII